MIRIATVFSGIGAAEQALKQLGVDHRIVFACDNGERYLKQTTEDIESLFSMTPYYYRTSQEGFSRLRTLERLTTRAEVEIYVYRKA